MFCTGQRSVQACGALFSLVSPDRLRQLVLAYRFHYLAQAQHLRGMFAIQHILSCGLRGASMVDAEFVRNYCLKLIISISTVKWRIW